MRRKRFTRVKALVLSAVLILTPAMSAFAEEEAAAVETEAAAAETDIQIPEVAAEVVAEEMTEPSEDVVYETEAAEQEEAAEEEPADEEPVEEAVEEPIKEAAEEITEPSSEEAAEETEAVKEETAEETKAEVTAVEETAATSALPEKTPEAVKVFEDAVVSMEADAETESPVTVVKADGTEFKMFKISGASVTTNGDKVHVVMSTANVSFDGFYIGSKDDETKEPIIYGTELPDGGWTFAYDVPRELAGTRTEIALHKAAGTWYTNQALFLELPEVEDEPEEEPLVETKLDVVKEDGTVFKMFQVGEGSGCKLTETGIEITIKTENTSFDGIYIGSKDDETKEPVFEGTQLSEGGWTFTFEVPKDFAGKKKEIALRKASGAWYSNQPLFLTIPVVKEEEKEPEEEEPGEEEPGDETDVPENGIYETTAVTGAAMFKVTKVVLTSKNGKMSAVITLSGKGYDYLYMGDKKDAYADKEENWIPAVIAKDGTYTYEIPVEALDQPLAVAARSSRYVEEGKGADAWIDRTITISSKDLKKIGDVSNAPEDGVYEATAVTGAAMFKVTKVVLTSKDGKMSAVITLSGKGYDYLYMGDKKAAYADKKENWIPAVIAEDGTYTYEIPVEALDQPLAVAARSSRYVEEGKGVDAWIDRTITIDSSSLKKIADVPGSKPGNKPSGGTTPSGSGSGTKPSGGSQSGGVITVVPEENDGKAENESKYESDLSGSTSSVNSETSLKDGVYTPDAFSWSGGTGKVRIECNKVTVKGGQAFATLSFSSTAYSYIKTNGRTYYTSISGGKAWVTIPVELNKNYKIIGMTTKMSQAHEIEYSIFVYLAAASGKAPGSVNGMVSSTNEALDEEAPVIMGIEYESETKLEHAQFFKMYNYEDGIVLLEIDMTKNTARDPEYLKTLEDESEDKKETEEATPEEAEASEEEKKEQKEYGEDGEEIIKTQEEICADLYMGNVIKYLIVPEDVVIPVGLDKEMIVINQGDKEAVKTLAASVSALPFMKELELFDTVAALAVDEEAVKDYKELSDALEKEGEKKEESKGEKKEDEEEEKVIANAGLFDSLDFKKIVKTEINLAIMNTEILPVIPEEENVEEVEEESKEEKEDEKAEVTEKEEAEEEELTSEEQIERLEKLTSHFAILGIPMIVDRSADEESEIASYEWIKVFGAIFGESEKANELFEKAVKEYEKTQKQ